MAQSVSPISATRSEEIIVSLSQAAAAMQTMQCRFVQQKTSSMLAEPTIAEGTMAYAAPDKMRWEYGKPYAFALIVNGDNIIRKADGKSEIVDAKSNRMYQSIVSIIMGSASGRKLFDKSMFDVVLFDEGGFWRAEMSPLKRDMKRMFSQLVFRFDKKTGIISRVEFLEAGGDVTSIRFEDVKIDATVEDSVFME